MSRRRRVLPVMAASLPWTWYLVRDSDPFLDWAAILMPALVCVGVVGLGLVAAVRRSAAFLSVCLAWLVFGASAVVGPWSPTGHGPPAGGTRIAAANVLAENASPTAVADDMLDLSADVLVVSELFGADETITQRLDAQYPHAFRTPVEAGVGIWSRFPLDGALLPVEGTLAATRGARVVVDAPSGPFALYAVHLYRPSRDVLGPEVTIEQQRTLVDGLDALAAGEPLPTVLAGDLNLTDRGSAYRRLAAGRRDALRTSWAAPTSFRLRNRPLLLRIDHILIPEQWCAAEAARARLTGSDHRAVVATVGPCR